MISSPKNVFKKKLQYETYNLYDILKKYYYSGYTFNNIKIEQNNITAYIRQYDKFINNNYMDNILRNFTKILSEDLRDFCGKNIYYDIVDGKIIIYK
jgi:hypothetical protein